MSADLRPDEPGTFDQWWPASGEDSPLVDMLVLGVAHHHATGHLCGGGGTSFECDECDFFIEEGVVIHGGWCRFKAATESADPPLLLVPEHSHIDGSLEVRE